MATSTVDPDVAGEGWREYRRLVMSTLEAQASELSALRKEMAANFDLLRREMAERNRDQDKDILALKLKAATWGVGTGSAGAALVVLLTKLMEKLAG